MRWFSSTCARHSGQFTVAASPSSSKQTVLDTIRSRKEALAAQSQAASPGSPDNAAVILASPDFATWLDDEAFLAALLQQLPLSQPRSSGGTETSVLCAVVAALAAPQTTASVRGGRDERPPVSGLSIAYGNSDALLPGMWRGDDGKAALRRSRGSIGSDLDRDVAVTVQVPPLAGAGADGDASLRVTLPLSNTIFQNGRRSTLLASRWQTLEQGGFQRQTLEARDHQLIVAPPSSSSSSSSSPVSSSPSTQDTTSVSAPLFALSEPLQIASGLGNIVRQVFDRDSAKPIPAARELEAAIPALLAARRKAAPALQDGALAVWGLVIPAPVVPVYEQLRARLQAQQQSPLDALASDADHTPAAEQQAAAQASAHFTELLAAGCRLHRILSGGGGWGLKQGLLSLDPQMSHPAAASLSSVAASSIGSDTLLPQQAPKILGEERRDEEMDDEAMLSFIRSFRNETHMGPVVSKNESGSEADTAGGAVDGVAMPGAYVQFFVAPLAAAPEKAQSLNHANAETGSDASGWSIALGAQAGYDGSLPILASDEDSQSDQVALIHNHFGAVSNHGIFLSAAARARNGGNGSNRSKDNGSGAHATRTKLDAHNAYVWGSMHPR
ncbi:6-phosphogluconate dehydrogenase [Sporothrix brasiliensis 5110]|uniref:6-phosphogluconate dehydrogenase n=1 Tax=Sporothrix brasiliensis 5110 TaxID=1398154 RepID=A0A0C2EZ66_9PEZI|nr:6-phosphogluconate dehydrogenase [Sporothrix brasiliensis 5110]KIH91784.1 6-phosphogluconate dehydrogenase [Sporothrix brasiliensis 5110]